MSDTQTSPRPELVQQIARLERRLERERAVRREAEAIAEKETRALYDQARRLALLEAVATESNLGASVERALANTLQRICEFTEWPLAHAYLRDEATNQPALRSTQLWFVRPGFDFGPFREASQRAIFTDGDGLPGRVMKSAASVWISDVTQDANFPRAPMARACGLSAAFAFPVLIGNEVAAVLEFFLDRELSPNPELLRTLDQIGAVLGRAIERDRAERRLRQTNDELQNRVVEAQAANAAKTTFLAVTSHEIRTPLNAVLGLAEALSRASLTVDQRELVDGIRDSGSMLLRLLNAVLDVAKIETGRVTLMTANFDLVPIPQTIARLWRTKALETGVTVNLDLSLLAQPCHIAADAGKIEQILANLLSNAIKFTPPGGQVTLRLSSADAAGRRRILAEVLDDGEGVPEADRERIFQPYEQTAAGREAGGAGLGLAICAGQVKAMGGVIAVTPRPKGGSRFWFEFEADIATPSDAAAPLEVEERPLRVLAAEDNPANRQVLRLLLEPVGIEPVFAEDGEEAVSAAASQVFDLILMDANMPRMDGVTAVRHIRALSGPSSRTPIHMVTANVFDDDRQRYHEAGADGVVAKPIIVADLYALLMSIAVDDHSESAAA